MAIHAEGRHLPNSANILCGKYASTDGSSGTVITIPAGRVWRGWVTLIAGGSVAGGSAAINSRATMQLSGSGTPAPASGQVLLQVPISVPSQSAVAANTGGAVATNRDAQFVTLFADASNALLVTVTQNTVTNFSATAFGELIA